jgi:hypothetical protein
MAKTLWVVFITSTILVVLAGFVLALGADDY